MPRTRKDRANARKSSGACLRQKQTSPGDGLAPGCSACGSSVKAPPPRGGSLPVRRNTTPGATRLRAGWAGLITARPGPIVSRRHCVAA